MLIRPAQRTDVPAILGLIRELAAYERAPEAVTATEDLLATALFAEQPVAYAQVAHLNNEVVGFALWYLTFSTWLGKPGIWLEDLFVRPEHRRAGLGRALLETIIHVARERGYGRVEWWVLDWNAPAHAFYRSLGATPEDEWTVWRVAL